MGDGQTATATVARGESRWCNQQLGRRPGTDECATCGFVQYTTPKAAETHQAHCRSLPRAQQDERASTIRHGKTTATKWKPHVSAISAMDTAASANIDLTDRLSRRVIDDFFKDKPIDTPHFLAMAGKTIQDIPGATQNGWAILVQTVAKRVLADSPGQQCLSDSS